MSGGSVGTRWWLTGLCVVVVAAGAWWLGQIRTPKQNIPVIIYLVDTLRADRLGTYGYGVRPTSPVIDALVAESVVFDNAYAPAPWTVPSVASLITSTFPCEHGVLSERNKLNSNLETLAEHLGRLGYFSLALYENPYSGPMIGLDRGYQISEHRKHPVEGVTSMAELVDSALKQASEEQFFLFVHTTEPHDIERVPTDFIQKFGFVRVDRRQEYYRAFWEYHQALAPDWSSREPLGTTDNSIEQRKAFDVLKDMNEDMDLLYDASVLWADDNLGGVIDRLKQRGVWNNAIFIFVSDHGEEFDEHGAWFHGQSVYEELMRAPLVIRFPGGKFGGKRINAPVSLVDIMPTILDYIGRPDLCVNCRGTSLMSKVQEADSSTIGAVSILAMRDDQKSYDWVSHPVRGNVNVAMRQGSWKGIWNHDVKSFELYDLAADPDEQTDLSNDNPELTRRLRDQAMEWLKACRENAYQAEEAGELDDETREQLRALGYVY
jgi:arylsulfatase A-like enzyme